MSCSPASFRHNDNKCTTLTGEAGPLQPGHPDKPLLFPLPDRSLARSPEVGTNLHHSTEDLRVQRSVSYGRLCECVLCHCATASSWRDSCGTSQLSETFKGRGAQDQDLSTVFRTGVRRNLSSQTGAALRAWFTTVICCITTSKTAAPNHILAESAPNPMC